MAAASACFTAHVLVSANAAPKSPELVVRCTQLMQLVAVGRSCLRSPDPV